LADVGYGISTLEGWLAQRPVLTLLEMEQKFERCEGYMYVAEPRAIP
jgi:hypothetical protein